jgi:hypothetical protein
MIKEPDERLKNALLPPRKRAHDQRACLRAPVWIGFDVVSKNVLPAISMSSRANSSSLPPPPLPLSPLSPEALLRSGKWWSFESHMPLDDNDRPLLSQNYPKRALDFASTRRSGISISMAVLFRARGARYWLFSLGDVICEVSGTVRNATDKFTHWRISLGRPNVVIAVEPRSPKGNFFLPPRVRLFRFVAISR